MGFKFGKYIVRMKCSNCGFLSEAKIPRGISVDEFVKDGKFKCDNCGVITSPEEYETKWLK